MLNSEVLSCFSGVIMRIKSFFLLCRLINLSTTVRRLYHIISLNSVARKDIQWWVDFLPTWNGISLFPDDNWTLAGALHAFIDASSKIGYGAYSNKELFCGLWPTHLCYDSIQWKELFAIYLACVVWEHLWSGKKLIFITDNSTNVAIWSSKSLKANDLMDLARKIFLISAQHAFLVQLTFKHIPSINNPIADALSRLQMEESEIWPQTPTPNQLWSQTTCFKSSSTVKSISKCCSSTSVRRVYNIGIKNFDSFVKLCMLFRSHLQNLFCVYLQPT